MNVVECVAIALLNTHTLMHELLSLPRPRWHISTIQPPPSPPYTPQHHTPHTLREAEKNGRQTKGARARLSGLGISGGMQL